MFLGFDAVREIRRGVACKDGETKMEVSSNIVSTYISSNFTIAFKGCNTCVCAGSDFWACTIMACP